MYVPPINRETDLATLHAFIAAHDFAVLTTVHDGAPFATHLPLLLDAERGPSGTLVGHMARANPQWRDFAGGEALVVFHGPHGYVSPNWYAGAPNVPTWNYVAVHAYGVPRVTEDAAAVRALLARLSARYEGDGPDAWTMDSVPESLITGLLKGIVAFELPIARLEGKYKLSQNKTAADRDGVMRALAMQDDPLGRQVAALMRAREPATGGG